MAETQKLIALAHCPACHSNQQRVYLPLKETTLVSCATCSLPYLNPCLSADAMIQAYEDEKSLMQYRSLHEGYYQYGDVSAPSQTRTEFTKALEMAENALENKKNPTVFDVGCGNGFFLALAKTRGWIPDGIDSSATNIKLAHEKFGLTLTPSSFEHYQAPVEKYDTVSFWDVIEHISDPWPVLQKASRMLKPNGTLLIGLPNNASLLIKIAWALYSLSFRTVTAPVKKLYFLEHVSYYDRSTLTTLLKHNHFKLENYFISITDLKKYHLPPMERLLLNLILGTSRWCGQGNRLVALFKKEILPS